MKLATGNATGICTRTCYKGFDTCYMHKATGSTVDKHKIDYLPSTRHCGLEHMIDGLSDPFGKLENMKGERDEYPFFLTPQLLL